MTRFLIMALLPPMVSSCSVSTPAPGTHYVMEDLVLIEFAARLEEDYHRLHPGQTNGKSPLVTGKTGASNPPVNVGTDEPHEPLQEPVEYDHDK